MEFLPTRYSPWGVTASILIAIFASYVALDLAKRVRAPDPKIATTWLIGGSISMGTGIWCMHFVGMLAFSLPIELGYTVALTVLSWVTAVLVSAIALKVASCPVFSWHKIGSGALAMGVGICAMHYLGMEALDMSPLIVWDLWLVFASFLIAVGASAAALLIFAFLNQSNEQRTLILQPLAAVVMGFAISGMHYTGMAAAQFPLDSICLSADALGGTQLGSIVAFSSIMLLAMTLLTSIIDARMRSSLSLANSKLASVNEELRQRAFIDPLTGLPNRLLFEDRLTHALQRYERTKEERPGRDARRVAVLFVDLDGFKPVNDTLGHAIGDEVLKEAALRLRRETRDSDTVARIGGDEFVLLMEDVSGLPDCASLAQRVIGALAEPMEIHGHKVTLAGSVGVAMYPEHGDQHHLVKHADAAMYTAKRAGGNTYALFEAHMNQGMQEQLCLQHDLRHAIERQQLRLHYQPKLDAIDGRLQGVEALLRWHHPEHGMVPPSVFIPIAERFGLINALGNWVIDESCRQMRTWAEQGLHMSVAINLSVHQLRTDTLVQRIDEALRRNHLHPSQLLCEITETVAMEDIRSTQRTFEGLSQIGVYLSIDDFGTGYSSLSYLRQLPARQLKIDRSFVADIEGRNDARAIVAAVIQLAHQLGLRVVAEGVETEAQRQILLDLQCDELQGFLLARPMDVDAFGHWMQHQPSPGRQAADALPRPGTTVPASRVRQPTPAPKTPLPSA
ncbi:MAG: EAL domain-containing protein [Lautropia sp.]|nr:EAL domain-containing protein [Lautropia sp.]